MLRYNVIITILLLAIRVSLASKVHPPGRIDLLYPHHRRHYPHREIGVIIENNLKNREQHLSLKNNYIVKRAGSGTAAFNNQASNTTARQSCAKAVESYPSVVNPSGIVACYNIISWDNSTGIFQTDIRLYQKSDSTGVFLGYAPSDFTMAMSIPQATLSAPQITMNGSTFSNNSANGRLLQGFENIGQLNPQITLSKLTESDLRTLLIPSIVLIARNNTTQGTTLSSDTLSYVAGKFVQANKPFTNITFPEAAALSGPLVSSLSKFVLPGTQIKVFPLGLIITGSWAALLVLVVGVGTVGRYRFRQHYRRRIQRAQGYNVNNKL